MHLASRLRTVLPALAAFAASCATPPDAEHADSGVNSSSYARIVDPSILPPASGPLDVSVAGGGKLTLEELLGRLSKLTGVTFSMQDQVGGQMKQTAVVLSQEKRVAAEDAYPWVEALLLQNGYSLGVLDNGASPLVGVYMTTMPGSGRPSAISIDSDRIDECRVHPALMFTTVLHLPHTDVRTLGNSLRGIASDPMNQQGILPVGNTNSVILQGTGRIVADLVAMLRTIDDNSQRDMAPAPKPEQTSAPQKQ
jgi:hypothetical protein